MYGFVPVAALFLHEEDNALYAAEPIPESPELGYYSVLPKLGYSTLRGASALLYSTTAEGYTNILSAISAYNGAVCGMVNGQVTIYGVSVTYYADICSTTDDDLPLGFVGYAGAGLS